MSDDGTVKVWVEMGEGACICERCPGCSLCDPASLGFHWKTRFDCPHHGIISPPDPQETEDG